jgi:hypothetical protein
MKVTKLKKYLISLDQQTMVSEVLELFRNFDMVKDYYETKLNPVIDTATLDKYKDVITHEFFPKRGFGKARLSVARKAVTDFKKVSKNPHQIIEIMLYYVEVGCRFTDEYGDIDEPFYNSMESMYESALKFIAKNKEQQQYSERCHQIAKNAIEGWGFEIS